MMTELTTLTAATGLLGGTMALTFLVSGISRHGVAHQLQRWAWRLDAAAKAIVAAQRTYREWVERYEEEGR